MISVDTETHFKELNKSNLFWFLVFLFFWIFLTRTNKLQNLISFSDHNSLSKLVPLKQHASGVADLH